MVLAALTALLLAAPVEAPVEAATVFGSGARLTRAAPVTLDGTAEVELPLLSDQVDPASIQLEAQGAEVRRAEIRHVDQAELPVSEARALLDALDTLDDQLARLTGEEEQCSALARLVGELRAHPSSALAGQPRPRLDPSPWKAGHDLVAGWLAKLQAQARDVQEQREALQRQRGPLLEKIRLMQARRTGGYRVVATVSGHGRSTLRLRYFTPSASWRPSYDLQLDPAAGRVQVSLSGDVTQQTGEDWSEVALTLSTAQPRTETALPQLTRWIIGERERFIPTPVAAAVPVAPPPPPAPPLRVRADDAAAQLERRLARLEREDASPEPSAKSVQPTPREQRPRPTAPPLPTGRSVNRAEAAPAAPSAAPQAQVEVAEEELQGEALRGRSARQERTQSVGLAPPPGFEPVLAPGTPAALAGGTDLSFPALRKETVESGGANRRVPLWATTWKVAVQRQLFPALAPEAFLTAELLSPERTVLPGGEARLFVGADPAGLAQLQRIAPGEKFSLPLGVDRALTPVRTVKLAQAEKGLFSKDEVTDYTVTIELANPYPTPTPVRIFDQWPLSRAEHVEVSLQETRPYAAQDAATGKLEWRATLPARAKETFLFRYRIRRPKGYRLTP